MKKEFVTNLQGKEFVLFEGLLNEFHENGGQIIDTVETQSSTPESPRFKATVTGKRGTYTGHGDADDNNVNRMISKHKYRMAETRAIARALRWYNNIGMCSADELGGDDKAYKKEENNDGGYICTKCDEKNNSPKLLPSKYGNGYYFFCSVCKQGSDNSKPYTGDPISIESRPF